MDSYLYRLAKTLYIEYGHRISNFTFVFPNRRAGLFFRKYLGQVVQTPIFAPDTITINQCFEQLSTLHLTDQLSLLFRLYNIYKTVYNPQESFDNFVFWGKTMLSDFNEIDAHLIDAKALFSNISNLKELNNQFDYLTDSQKRIISEFWNDITPNILLGHKQKFLSLWSCLYEIYHLFTTELIADGEVYDGLLRRKVIETLDTPQNATKTVGKQFIFVGFNALTPCEKKLFEWFQKNNQADFYWDYESDMLQDEHNRASLFYKTNTTIFPSKIKIIESENSEKRPEMHLISIPSDVGQAKQVCQILEQLFPDDTQKDFTQTAIVLPDEHTLLPILHSIPTQINSINVTMGYPLSATPIFAFMEHVFDLQMRVRKSNDGQVLFYHRSVENILNHQYIYDICPEESKEILQDMVAYNRIYISAEKLNTHNVLRHIFIPQTTPESIIDYAYDLLKVLQKNIVDNSSSSTTQLDREYIYQYYATINRLRDLFRQKYAPKDIKPETIFKLIREITARITIPFVGEPLNGLQIMGVLETRALDFDNLIITSMNEGAFPKRQDDVSFVPYNLRRGFGLPTYEQQDAIFSYHFYRMIKCAKRVYFIYNSHAEGSKKGEVSRYIHQLRYQYGYALQEEKTSFGLSGCQNGEIKMEKTEHVLAKLDTLADANIGRGLSASALNTYLDCPLKFYLSYIYQLAEVDEIKETIESNLFGTILHATMQNIYEPYCGQMIQSVTIGHLLNDKNLITNKIYRAYTDNSLRQKDGAIVIPEGHDLLVMQIIETYVRQLLENDRLHCPFFYIDSEWLGVIELPILNGSKRVKLKGFIDRIDEKEGVVRIIDYKSGQGSLDFKNLEDVFDSENKNRPKYVLQTFCYCLLYQQKSDKQLAPHIFYVRKSNKQPFESQIFMKQNKQPVNDFQEYAQEFTERLTLLLEEIYNPQIPFAQCADKKHCTYCSFSNICNR